jgi:hypothetical protein
LLILLDLLFLLGLHLFNLSLGFGGCHFGLSSLFLLLGFFFLGVLFSSFGDFLSSVILLDNNGSRSYYRSGRSYDRRGLFLAT